MVHRDIKPENCLVSNRHYSQKHEVDEGLIKKQPIVVKLGDLGEARSAIIKTKAIQSTNASKTKNVVRGSPAFMAPELLVKDIRLKHADINQLKKADVWSLMMTLFLAINPNQRMPYENDNAQSEYDIISLMEANKIPSPSECYLKAHATQYQMLHYLYQKKLSFEPDDRGTASEIHCLIEQEVSAEMKFSPLVWST